MDVSVRGYQVHTRELATCDEREPNPRGVVAVSDGKYICTVHAVNGVEEKNNIAKVQTRKRVSRGAKKTNNFAQPFTVPRRRCKYPCWLGWCMLHSFRNHHVRGRWKDRSGPVDVGQNASWTEG